MSLKAQLDREDESCNCLAQKAESTHFIQIAKLFAEVDYIAEMLMDVLQPIGKISRQAQRLDSWKSFTDRQQIAAAFVG